MSGTLLKTLLMKSRKLLLLSILQALMHSNSDLFSSFMVRHMAILAHHIPALTQSQDLWQKRNQLVLSSSRPPPTFPLRQPLQQPTAPSPSQQALDSITATSSLDPSPQTSAEAQTSAGGRRGYSTSQQLNQRHTPANDQETESGS